jgi:hypothetical protein
VTRNGYIALAIALLVLLAFTVGSTGSWELVAVVAVCGLLILLMNHRKNRSRED